MLCRPSPTSLSTRFPCETEKSSLSQLVCPLKSEDYLLFKQACGISTARNWAYLLLLTAEWAPASLRHWQINREGIYWGGGHRSFVADALIIDSISTLRHHRVPAVTKWNNTVNMGILCRHKYEQINNQHSFMRTHHKFAPCWPINAQYKVEILSHSHRRCSTDLQASGTRKYSAYTWNCCHLQRKFNDKLTYSALINSWGPSCLNGYIIGLMITQKRARFEAF